jgi:methionine-rich copper-binding protein CopC
MRQAGLITSCGITVLPALTCCATAIAHLHLQDPNPEDPLNKEAAAKFQENQRQFESYVQRSIHYGAQIDGEYFPPCAC